MAFASTATPFTLISTLAATQKRSSSPAINIAARRIMQQTMVAPGRQLQQQWEQRKEQQPATREIADIKPREEEKESGHEHVHEQHDVKCVCELCSCGTHACPRTPRSAERYESSMKSHYGDTYIHHGYDRAPPRVNKSDVEKDTMGATGVKFYNGNSTFKSDYPAYNVPPPAPAVPLGQSISIVDRDAPFTHTTNYSDQYPYKSIHVPRAKAPPTVFETAGKFEAESVAKTDYKPWERCASQSCRPAQRRTVPDETRDFQTTSASAFNEKGNVARPPIMPFSTPHIESDKFDATSTVKSDFPDWGKVTPAESCKPKERRDADEPDERQFETEKSSQFRRHNAPPIVRATAPLSHVLDTDTQFYQGVSATRDHFRGTHAEPAQILRPKYTFQPGEEENRNFMSEARSQFPHKHVEVIRAREAPSVFAPEADDRSFQSETSSAMKNHGYQARPSFKPEKEKIETTPFLGTSTNQEMYQKWNEKPRETCAPRHTLKLEEETRDFLTEFGQHYTPKERETCISSTLPDRHIKPTSGHLYYEKKGDAPWKKI